MDNLKRKIFSLFEHLDFYFYKENYLAVFALVLCYLYIKISNVAEIYENTIFENIAILPLVIGGGLACRAKKYKVFFRLVLLAVVLMIAREFSYGRVFFAQIPNTHDYYTWSHYKYGFLADIFVGIYIALGILYGLINKVWIEIVDIIKKVEFPVWSFLSLFILVIIQIYFEKHHNSLVEETAETMIYCLILAVIIIYMKKLKA